LGGERMKELELSEEDRERLGITGVYYWNEFKNSMAENLAVRSKKGKKRI